MIAADKSSVVAMMVLLFITWYMCVLVEWLSIQASGAPEQACGQYDGSDAID